MEKSRLERLRRGVQAREHRLVTLARRVQAMLRPLPEHDRAWVEGFFAQKKPQVHGLTQEAIWGFLEKLPSDGLILDVGTSSRRIHPRAFSIDLQEGADLQWNILQGLPFCRGTFDMVVCTAVLEHVPEPELVVSEIHRVLRRGGRVHCAIPFLQPYHEAPGDYQRYTVSGIRRLFRTFQEERVGWSSGFGETLAWIMREWRSVVLPELSAGILKEVFVDRWTDLEKAVSALDQNRRLHSDFSRGLNVAGGIFFEGIKR